MRIFGKNFITKKELKQTITELKCENRELRDMFPLIIGQIVYDVQFRNKNGKYAKKNISFEHSLINEVIVNEKNYFNLVGRYRNHDVFANKDEAEVYLRRTSMANDENNI